MEPRFPYTSILKDEAARANWEDLEAFLNEEESAQPPANPVQGQHWYYPADPADGVRWHFIYNEASASPHKWEFVGGSDLHAGVAGPGEVKAAFAVIAEIAVPFAGDYDIETRIQFYTGREAQTAIEGPGLAAVAIGYTALESAFNAYEIGHRRVTFTAAGTAKVVVSGTAASKWQDAECWLTPVRVG